MSELLFDPTPPHDPKEAGAKLDRVADYLRATSPLSMPDVGEWIARREAALICRVLAYSLAFPAYQPRSDGFREYWPTGRNSYDSAAQEAANR